MYSISSKTLLLLCALLLCGCVSLPLDNEGIDDPALLKISQAFSETVQAAYNDPNKQWQSGWVGNMWIHFSESEQRGLCYEWKYLVYAGVRKTVKDVGWEIRGIAVKENTPHEHHAVLVYNPAKVSETNLLSANEDAPVYVLDAWRQGKADIYHLRDWSGPGDSLQPTPRIFSIEAQTR